MNLFATKFLPKFFREVIIHIPTLALKSMDWKGLAKEIAPLAARLGKRNLEEDLLHSMEHLDIAGISYCVASQSTSVENNFSELTKDQKRETGEAILRLYFSQLKNEKGLVLDIRPKWFRRENGLVSFSPSNMWFSFDENFRLALIDLYRGFYSDRLELFDSALARIGLTKNLDESQKERLKDLFREHFGPGDQEEVLFELDHFKESFYELFRFFIDHEVSLEKDMIFLGIYLVGLYMNLEKLGVKLNVRKVYGEVFP